MAVRKLLKRIVLPIFAAACLLAAGAAAQESQTPAGGYPDRRDDPNKPYRIDWQRGTITQIVCANGAYYTLRYSESRKRYFVQELVNVSDPDLDKAAAAACQF